MQEQLSASGRTLGDFLVGAKLDEGGFGEVYRAQQRSLDREAIVKILRRDRGDGSQRFLREARLAAQIDHPYAAHVYAFGAESDGLLWIAMELVQGTPLATLLRVQGPWALDRFVPFFERLCEVVHAVHERGIIHRDIKPANIMVVSHAGRMIPKLIDLGIATYVGRDLADTIDQQRGELPDDATGSITRTGQLVGSPLYMAPEQWTDPMRVTARADLYALALVAYECLAGRPAFQGTTVGELERLHCEEPPPPLPVGLPAAIQRELVRALAKHPAERHTDPLVLAAALRTASGLVTTVAQVPRLPAALVATMLDRAPRPIADAIAILDGAATLRQVRSAFVQTCRAIVRYLGAVTLAARAGLPAAAGTLEPARELLELLARRPLADHEWSRLTAAVCQPLLAVRDAFAVPEQLDFIAGLRPGRDALALVIAAMASPPTLDDEAERRSLAQSMSDLAALLTGLEFLSSYELVAGETRWMGARTNPVAPDGEPAVRLCGPDGDAIVELGPLMRVSAPLPGAPPELFVFDGRGPRGAVLKTASGMELAAPDTLWDWLGQHLVPLGTTLGPASEEVAPYPGLTAFTIGDAGRFFGRAGALAAFRNRLHAAPLLAIVGASGAGKSSFALAGVAADLTRESRTIVVRPGAAPVAALAAALATALPLDRAEIEDELADPEWLGRRLRALATVEPRGSGIGNDGRGTLLIVDQLEELFTTCRDEAARRVFALALAGAARTAADPVRVVVTLRHDFLARAQELPGLNDRIADGLFLLGAPSRDDLLHAIVQPALRAGYTFDDPELPAQMVAEVAGRPGALPLLAFAAARLWELRDPQFRALRASAYRSLGGVAGALIRHADATLDELPASDQHRARDMFVRLVTAEGTRAALSRDEAVRVAGGDAAAERVVEALLTSRLVVARELDDAGEQLELAHEALIVEWPRLARWREDDRVDARLRDQVSAAARAWSTRGRPTGLVWRNEALVDLERWLDRAPVLTEVEADFVSASRREALRGRRRRRALLAGSAFAATAAIVVVFVLSTRAARERGRSTALAQSVKTQQALALYERGRSAALAGRSAPAALDLVRSLELGHDVTATRMMLADVLRPLRASKAILTGHRERLVRIVVSPDRMRFASASADGTVRLWSVDGKLLRVLAHDGPVHTVAYTADGSRLVTGSGDERARLWDASGGLVATLDAGGLHVLAIACSPDSRVIVTTTQDGKVRVWAAADGRLLRALPDQQDGFNRVWAAFHGNEQVITASDQETTLTVTLIATGERRAIDIGAKVDRLAVTRTGKIVVAADDRTIRVLARELHELARFNADKITSIALSPDGTRLATGANTGAVRTYDLERLQAVAEVTRHPGMVNVLAFSLSGDLLASAATDSVRVSSIGQAIDVAQLDGHGGKVWTIEFLDERRAVTGSLDGDVRIWDASPQRLIEVHSLGTFAGHWGADPALAIDPGGTRALAANRGAIIVDLASGMIRHRLLLDRSLTAVAWSPDGNEVACGDLEGTVHVGRPGATMRSFRIGNQPIESVAFSPDGRLVAASASESRVGVIVLRDGSVQVASTAGGVGALAWGPDGSLALESEGRPAIWRAGQLVASRTASTTGANVMHFDSNGLVIGTTSGAVVELDPATLTRRRDLVGHQAEVRTLVRSSNFLVTASYDSTARIWNQRGESVALRGHLSGLLGAAAIGELVGTAGYDDTARIWDPGTGDELATIVAHRRGVMAIAGVGERLATTGADRVLRIWRVEVDRRPIALIAGEVACLTGKTLDSRSTPTKPCSLATPR